MKKTIVVSVVNQKGGVAKTTSALAIAHSMAMHFNKKVLLIDLDPQGNASSMYSDSIKEKKTIYEVLIEKNHINDVIVKTNIDNLHIIGANNNLSAIQTELINEYSREARLKSSISKLNGKYDIIILDCPPSLSLLTINALTASDQVLVPMVGELYSLDGFQSLYSSIEKVQEYLNEDLEILGIFLTLFDKRLNMHNLFYKMIVEKMGDFVFNTVIPRNVAVSESANHYKSIFEYSPKSQGASAYNQLTEEILKKLNLDFINNFNDEEKEDLENG